MDLKDACVNSNVYLILTENLNFSNPGKWFLKTFVALPISCFFKVLSILTAVVGSTWLIKLRMAARTWQSARMICCSNLRAADLTLAWKGKENIQKLQNWQNLTQILFIWAYSFSLNNNVHNETELFIKYYFLFWYCSWLFSTNSLPYFDLNCSLSQKNA